MNEHPEIYAAVPMGWVQNHRHPHPEPVKLFQHEEEPIVGSSQVASTILCVMNWGKLNATGNAPSLVKSNSGGISFPLGNRDPSTLNSSKNS